MAKTKRIDPETRAQWAENTARLRRRVDELRAEHERRAERIARRRARLRRLSFGLLGR